MVIYDDHNHPEKISVVMPNKEDALVLMGLAATNIRFSIGHLPEESGFQLERTLDYKSLNKDIGKVDRLYQINLNLMRSFNTIPMTMILDNVKPGKVYELISSFLSLPIIDEKGKRRYQNATNGGNRDGLIQYSLNGNL